MHRTDYIDGVIDPFSKVSMIGEIIYIHTELPSVADDVPAMRLDTVSRPLPRNE